MKDFANWIAKRKDNNGFSCKFSVGSWLTLGNMESRALKKHGLWKTKTCQWSKNLNRVWVSHK